jgi:hypothetical protein
MSQAWMLSSCFSAGAIAARAAAFFLGCWTQGGVDCRNLLLLLQIHVRGSEVMYFSRRGREHGRLSDYVVFDDVVRHQVWSWRLLLMVMLLLMLLVDFCWFGSYTAASGWSGCFERSR